MGTKEISLKLTYRKSLKNRFLLLERPLLNTDKGPSYLYKPLSAALPKLMRYKRAALFALLYHYVRLY